MKLSGNPIDFVLVFLGGVTLSFSPCVYPLIPITASYIGINALGSKLKGLLFSFIYVTGIAITYAFLGILASLTGKLFGRVSSHPVTFILVGLIIIFFGFSMLNVFAMYLPTIINLSRFKRKGMLSVLILGLASGFVASPCVAPALGSILVYLTTTKNIIYGVGLLMAFAYGMGLILILIGTFSAMLLHLPKSGKWMQYVEKICAVILIGVGIYFTYNGIRRI
jgi:thiol:disulfide interchange protein DsbD